MLYIHLRILYIDPLAQALRWQRLQNPAARVLVALGAELVAPHLSAIVALCRNQLGLLL